MKFAFVVSAAVISTVVSVSALANARPAQNQRYSSADDINMKQHLNGRTPSEMKNICPKLASAKVNMFRDLATPNSTTRAQGRNKAQ